ncbi:MAG: S-ribosylhomocysteine lyase, partial [Fimbriimonadaceae bacterium]|nr:S-ribosylhomocysteine lyase [Fimbriimonadaceae bacterium]
MPAELEVVVESFSLDHTKVVAPYVRLAGKKVTPQGDVIEKYDLRLGQPNRDILPTSTLHTLEHLLAYRLRAHLPGLVDISPMGCRTGFYAVVLEEPGEERVMDAFGKALKDAAEFEGIVPGVSELECGNA